MDEFMHILSLFLAGLLAGEEFIVRYGVHPALNRMSSVAHLEARQALIRRLRLVVPSLMGPTIIVAIIWTVLAQGTTGSSFRIAALCAYAAFVLFSFFGTVPINMAVGKWSALNPPENWKHVVSRWVFIDTFRSSAAILAFALLLAGSPTA